MLRQVFQRSFKLNGKDKMTERPLNWYKKLQNINARKESGYFMVEGYNTISQIAAVFPSSITEILYTEDIPPQLIRYPARFVQASKMAGILASKTPQGLAALVRVPKESYAGVLPAKPGSRVLLLDGVADPGNTGTLIRSAAALGFDGVVLTNDGCDALSPKVVAASAGTLFSVWLKRMPDAAMAINYFKQKGYRIVGTSLNGKDDVNVLKEEKLLLVLGNEARGLSSETATQCDHTLRLPIDHIKAESLNVAVAGSICMYLARH
jgi:TrmH family RNA methyltransferase